MKPGTYKHKNNTDVAMQVIRSYWIPEKQGWKAKVNWINIVNPANPYLLTKDNVFVTKDQRKNWESYDAAV